MTRSAILDTHAWVWALSAPDRLSEAARTVIEDPTIALFVSAATPWEMAIKNRSGRWPSVTRLIDDHAGLLDRLGASELPISGGHAIRAGRLDWAHTDPFDRMLVAQALSEGAPLISRDTAFDDVTGLPLIW